MYCLIDSLSKNDTFDFVMGIGLCQKNITHSAKLFESIFLTTTLPLRTPRAKPAEQDTCLIIELRSIKLFRLFILLVPSGYDR